MIVYGTRPEAIKVAPVIRALASSNDLEPVTVVTGQHREMLDEVNTIFGITPDHDLDIFEHGAPLSMIVARILERLDRVLAAEQPSAVVVQGDTSTSIAAAMAAFHRHIPVVHVEAGLRSGDLRAPFPEEANRRLTAQLTALHLAPTATGRDNLVREGTPPDSVVVTGNTVIDALLATAEKKHRFADPALEDLADSGRRVLLVTTHRRESWGEAMHGVGRALRRLAERFPDTQIVLPVHRNPVVRDAVLPHLVGRPNITVTEPLPYGEFTRLISLASLVLTDSGGIQEEAPALGKPVLVMRDSTERPEGVAAGVVRLVGTEEDRIVADVSTLLSDARAYDAMARTASPYGDGQGARRAVAAIAHLLELGPRPDDWEPERRNEQGPTTPLDDRNKEHPCSRPSS